MPEITVAKTAGFCFGVGKAVDKVLSLIASGEKNIYTLGELIHNPSIISELKCHGIKVALCAQDIPDGAIAVIRTHGAAHEEKKQLEGRTKVEDLTCPFVQRIQQLAAKASSESKPFIIAGDIDHPEVAGIRGYYSGEAFYAVRSIEELEELLQRVNFSRKEIYLAAQTTFNEALWRNICAYFAKMHYTNISIFDTICIATSKRQSEADKLSQTCDAMIVIGGKNSANTRRLYEICKQHCVCTYLVENAGELAEYDLKNKSHVGITAGASTPVDIIEEVIKTMEENENMEAVKELSFEEALEQSFKTVRRGQIITGTIMAIMPNEIQVDVGAKYTGILPMDELSGNTADILKQYKIGDEIEAQVIKTNDVEGTATLSKKMMDAQKAWVEISEAVDDGRILAGKVTNSVNGGVVVTYQSNRVFIPASQITSDRQADLSQLEGQTVQFKIIEVDRRRRRVIGSVKRASSEMRKEAKDRILSEIEVGKQYEGVVRSLTSYGAFVNIGGIDGMVHITELSWNKIKHPSEVVNVGDVITVYVKDFDPETGRISLGYKNEKENPMEQFKQKYKVDDIVDVKIVKLMKYGAFAEIIPGVDGLIHISEIAPEHIEKVADKLKIGDVVAAKIIEMDFERNRISLSIKAALPEPEFTEPAATQPEQAAEATVVQEPTEEAKENE